MDYWYVKQSNRTLKLNNLFKLSVLMLAVVFVQGCLQAAPPPVPPPSSCSDPFEKVIDPIRIQDKHHIYFDLDDFDFLDNPNIHIDNAMLEGTLVRRHCRRKEYNFSLNGIKSYRKDGRRNIYWSCGKAWRDEDNDEDKDRSDHDDKDTRPFCSPMHKFFLNGGMPFHHYIIKLRKQKGELRLGLHGRNGHVTSAKLVVSGKIYKSCDNPPPPPPPTPVAPDTFIDSFSPNSFPTNISTMQLNFSSDQSGVTYYCSLDNQASAPCTSPLLLNNLSNGDHSFSVYAKNSAGLSDSTPDVLAWNVDTVAPDVTIDNRASLPTLTNLNSIELQFSSADAVSFQCTLDDGATGTCQSPMIYNGLSEGNHSVMIRGVDAAGNISESPAVFQWRIDQTPPTTMIISASPASVLNNSVMMSLQFAANETATLYCSVDNGAFQQCQSPLELNNLSEGSHWFVVHAVDLAGNRGPDASFNWTTDLTTPVIQLGNITPAQGLTNSRNASVEFSSSEPMSYQCELDGVALESCNSPWSYVFDSEGPHILVISGNDVAGNAAAPVSVVWNMDFSAPIISFGVVSPSASQFINVSDFSAEVNSSESVVLAAKVNGVDIGSVVSPIELLNLAEGNYVLEVQGTDSSGNASNVISHSFTVDMTAPTLQLNSQIVGLTQLDSNSLDFTANEAASFSCNVDGAGYGDCTSPLNLAGLADGLHVVEVKAIDSASNVSAQASAQWTVDTTAPVIISSLSQINTNSFSIAFSAEEPSLFSCSLNGSAPQACTSPMTYNNLATGNYVFVVWATDAAGNVNPAGNSHAFFALKPITTTITSYSPSASLSNITSASFSFTSNDPSATFVCSLDGAPATACTSPKSYSGLSSASHNFKVQAVDSFGNIDSIGAVRSWTVDTVAPVMVTISASATSTTITVNWTTNEPSTSRLLWGRDFTLNQVVPDDGVYRTSHSIRLTGLSSNTVYSLRPEGRDQAGNTWQAPSSLTIRTAR